MKKNKDLTGQKFNKWTVIKRSKDKICNNKYRKRMWLCRCDCGTKKSIYESSLTNGTSKGCARCAKGKDSGVASMNYLFSKYKQSANRRGHSFELTKEQFKEITQQDCYYCGAKPNQKVGMEMLFGEYIHNGIDRVDNNKGYTIDNVVPCCKICNYAKRELTLQEFKGWVKKVYNKLWEYNNGKNV